MSKSVFALIFASILFFLPLSRAEIVILKPTGPSTFATVNGVTGLSSETLTGGTVNISSGSVSTSAAVDSTGTFSVTVTTDSPFNVNANLTLEELPGINMSFSNFAALSENEVREVNLVRPSGRGGAA